MHETERDRQKDKDRYIITERHIDYKCIQRVREREREREKEKGTEREREQERDREQERESGRQRE